MTTSRTLPGQWLITLTTLVCGAACGIHIAKLGPSMQSVMESFGLSLSEAGLLASTFSLLTIFIGVFVGNIISNFGLKRFICLAMLFLTFGSLSALIFKTYTSLIVGRALEGIGLIIMMIAGPTTISIFTNQNSIAKHMGVWSAFMPLGTALSFLVAPILIPIGGWRSVWDFSLIFSVFALAAAWLWIPKDAHLAKVKYDHKLLKRTLGQTALIWIGCIFAMHSLVFHIVLQFIPIYGLDSLGSSLLTVSYVIAGFCILNVFGNFIAGNAIHRGIRPSHLISLHFIAVPILAALLFFPGIADDIRFIALILGALFTSLTPSAAFTIITKLTSKKSEIPAFNGLMLQVQGGGILFGPSLTGWAVDTFDSWSAAAFILFCASIIVLLIVNIKLKPVEMLT